MLKFTDMITVLNFKVMSDNFNVAGSYGQQQFIVTNL
jgi:hypothetical protein